MKPLRHYLFATASSVALLGSAAAQPPAPPVMSWAGPYAGLDLGAAWHRSSFTDVDNFAFLLPGGINNNFWTNTRAGVTVGGLLGYNWQINNFVYGVEGDLSWIDGKASASIPTVIQIGVPAVASTNLQWMSTLRGRAGLAYGPTLFYGTGGLAVARISDSWGIPGAMVDSDHTRAGWTAGGGVEHMFAPNWTGRIEALYADFGKTTETASFSNTTYRTDFEHSVALVRAALNWKW
jgi:outer membrane immunogenic protein